MRTFALILFVRGFAEVYGTPSILPSADEERARYELALGGEIAKQLLHLPGVADASVVVSAAPPDPLGAPAPPASASVVLRVDGAGPRLDDVKRLVAAASPGLREEDVAVVVAPALPPKAKPTKKFPTKMVLAILLGLVAVAGTAVIAVESARKRTRA